MRIFGNILPFIGFKRGWPVDNTGMPLEGYGTEQSHYVGDLFVIEWGVLGFIFFVKNIRKNEKVFSR